MPAVTEPVTVCDSKTFGFLCCTSGPLSSTLNIPRQGYAPGEAIPISAEVENLSDKTMSKTEAKLMQYIVFHSNRGKSKRTERCIRVRNITFTQVMTRKINKNYVPNILYTLNFTYTLFYRRLKKEKYKLEKVSLGKG